MLKWSTQKRRGTWTDHLARHWLRIEHLRVVLRYCLTRHRHLLLIVLLRIVLLLRHLLLSILHLIHWLLVSLCVLLLRCLFANRHVLWSLAGRYILLLASSSRYALLLWHCLTRVLLTCDRDVLAAGYLLPPWRIEIPVGHGFFSVEGRDGYIFFVSFPWILSYWYLYIFLASQGSNLIQSYGLRQEQHTRNISRAGDNFPLIVTEEIQKQARLSCLGFSGIIIIICIVGPTNRKSISLNYLFIYGEIRCTPIKIFLIRYCPSKIFKLEIYPFK